MPTDKKHCGAAEFNWRAMYGDTPICPHYIGGSDWGTDCDLMYGLCGGPNDADCPKRNLECHQLDGVPRSKP